MEDAIIDPQKASQQWLHALALVALVFATPGSAQDGDWRSFGRDPGGSQHSPLSQINTGNVAKLKPAWTHRTGDFVEASLPDGGTVLQATPLHIDGTLYFCTPMNRIFALDARSGRERWVFDPHRPDARTGREALSEPLARPRRCRGVAYWEAAGGSSASEEVCRARIFMNGDAARVYAVDAATGEPCSDFGAGQGHAGWVTHLDFENHGEGMAGAATSPPAILGDMVIAAMATGDGITNARNGFVRAFDVRSGELMWEFDPIPVEHRHITGAANVWSTISVDVERHLVFLPTTSPSTDYYGGERRIDMPLVNAIVALHGATGEVAWSYQTVRHDLFDYDLVGHPLLVDIQRDGRTIPAALLQTKMGWLFGFERSSGEPLWPIVDRAVPATDVIGDQAAPTQPVPEQMAAFSRQELSREELFGLTPIDRYFCRRQFDRLRYDGMYTPPSMRGAILFPSALGGGNWGGAAYDPASNLLIIKAENLATVIRMVAKQDVEAEDAKPPQDYLTRPLVGTPYKVEGEIFLSPLGIPCTPPPWGTLTALDMGTGEIRWQIPLGQVRRAGMNVPKRFGWGSPNVGGPITTAGGLTFIGATMDSKFRALETVTGEELWVSDLPVPGMAVPMTYAIDGRQYVVIAAGGNAQVGTRIGDYLIAYTLPE